MDLGRNADNFEKTKRLRRECVPDEFRQRWQMSGGVIVHEQDFILVGQRLRQTIKAKGGSFVEVETVVIVSTVGNDRKHLGTSPHRKNRPDKIAVFRTLGHSQHFYARMIPATAHHDLNNCPKLRNVLGMDSTGRSANRSLSCSVFQSGCSIVASPKQIFKVVPACLT